MKTNKLSFDFSDTPDLVELLRLEAVKTKSSQKGIVVKALESYFSNKLEASLLSNTANQMFKEWDNDEDSVYDKL